MRKILSFIIIMFLVSCSSKQTVNYYRQNIKVVKFMYVADYPMSISTNTFWNCKDEHATMILDGNYNKEFMKRLKLIQKDTLKKFGFINYAFIFTNNNKLDTIYADSSLKAYMIKKKDNHFYCHYSQNNSLIDDAIIDMYPFFDSCW